MGDSLNYFIKSQMSEAIIKKYYERMHEAWVNSSLMWKQITKDFKNEN